jgi:hypothetical protein
MMWVEGSASDLSPAAPRRTVCGRPAFTWSGGRICWKRPYDQARSVFEARKKRLKGAHRATGDVLLPAAPAPGKRLSPVEFFVEAHFSAPRYTTKRERERGSSPDFGSPVFRSPHLIGPNVSLISRRGARKAGPRAPGTSTSSADTKPTDGPRRRLAGRRNSGVRCREGKETLTLGAGWTLFKCPGKEAVPNAGPFGLTPAVVNAGSAS